MNEVKTLEDVTGFLLSVAEHELKNTRRIPTRDGSITIIEGSYQYMMNVIKWVEKKSEQPKLNENQEIVLGWLKNQSKNNLAPILMLSKFSWEHFGNELPEDIAKAYQALNDRKDDLEILQAFANWALDQC